MSDDVSREVFDEVVKRLETRINAVEDTAAIAISDLHNRIDDLKDRINELQNSIVRGWTILGVLAAVCALAFAGVQWYLAAKGV